MRKNLINCILGLQKFVDADIRKFQSKIYSLYDQVKSYPVFIDDDPDRLFTTAKSGIFLETKEFMTLQFENNKQIFYITQRDLAFENIYWINRFNVDGNNCLMIAVMHRHLKFVEFLIENGATLNWQNNNGETALHIAVINGQIEMVELLFNKLVEREAVANLLTKAGKTPLDLAYEFDHKQIISLFLFSKVELIAREFLKDLHRYTKFSYSCSLKEYLCGYNAILTSLIQATTAAIINLLIKAQSKEVAALPPRDSIIEEIFSADTDNLLLKKLLGNLIINLTNDDDIDYKFADGLTLLLLAAQLNDIEMVKSLLTKGAKIQIDANHAFTELLLSSIHNNDYEFTQLLVSAGMQITSDTLKLVVRQERIEIFNLFKSELALRKAEKNLAMNTSTNKSATFQPENNYEKFFGEALAYDSNHFHNYVSRVITRQVKTFTNEMRERFVKLNLVMEILNAQQEVVANNSSLSGP
jgi:ankyrin repeat protein